MNLECLLIFRYFLVQNLLSRVIFDLSKYWKWFFCLIECSSTQNKFYILAILDRNRIENFTRVTSNIVNSSSSTDIKVLYDQVTLWFTFYIQVNWVGNRGWIIPPHILLYQFSLISIFLKRQPTYTGCEICEEDKTEQRAVKKILNFLL